MQKIIPFLWFDNNAEEAVNFYISIFKNSKINNITYYGDAAAKVSGRPKGSVMTISFQLNGQQFEALNGGPYFNFSPAISFLVNCETQKKVNNFWKNLSKDGEIEKCGWLKDKYGVSWQIVPVILNKMLNDTDPLKVQRVMKAMLKMKKLDINILKQAYEQK